MADKVFYKNNGPKTIEEIAKITGAEIVTEGHNNDLIENVCSLDTASSNDLCFFYDKKNKAKAAEIIPVEENIDNIPPAKEKSDYKKGLTSEEIEELEYNQAVRDHETIDDIFSEIDDID